MKSATRFLTFALALVAVAQAYPGTRSSKPESSAEEPEQLFIIGGGSDLEDGFDKGFFASIQDPFDGFLTSVQSMMSRLRKQMFDALPNYHGAGFFGFGDIPEGANSTSTTKVIDGHLVTINETTYATGDDNSGSVFRIRIVDIKPDDEETIGNPDAEGIATANPDDELQPTQTTRASVDRDVESVEDFNENEIPKRLVQVTAA
ncbi:icarapin-like [Athalia rosae]|uniref:icarapin-like n=1 Tax=Athalia rosae TaxID=37344 RepID=UPI002033DB2A|nr:icarapin-like [Athalia rosae]